MTDNHPITPPPELLSRWEEDWYHAKVKHIDLEDHIATQATRWGYEAIENWEEPGWAKIYEGEIAYWQPLPQWPANALPTPEAKP